MISARFCVYNKQGTPNDVANVREMVDKSATNAKKINLS